MTWSFYKKDLGSILNTIISGRWTILWASLLRYLFRRKSHGGVNVVDKDWDYLILLDACRYDIFAQENWLEGQLEKVTSQGSTSIEFLNKNFTDYYDDIVYISANGFVNPLDIEDSNYARKPFNSDEHFHDVIPLFMDDDAQEKGVTKPEAVTAAAIEADKEYPHKRKIIHYMQPHTPFIGEYQLTDEEAKHHEDLLSKGNSWEEIEKAYRSNLRRVLESVEELLEHIDGRIVITADHGEALGEWGLSMHPHSIYIKELVEVPWFVINQGERPKIIGEGSVAGIDV